MIDIQETKKVNNAMVEIMKQSLADPRIMLSMEGYLVSSDSNQNPHTSIEVFLNSMDLRGYTVMGEILSKEFGFGYSIESIIRGSARDCFSISTIALFTFFVSCMSIIFIPP